MDVTKLAQDALTRFSELGMTVSEKIGEAARAIRDFLHQVGAQMLELHLAGKKLGYEGSSRACSCGKNQKFIQYRPRTLATSLGQVCYKRAYYHCSQCGESCCPYDRECGLGKSQVSDEFASMATLLAVHDPFQPSSQILRRLSGHGLDESTIQRLTRVVGTKAAMDEKKLALRMAVWDAPPAIAKPLRLYVAVDATTLHLKDGWHDAKCVVCWWEDERGRKQRRCMVRRETAEEFKAFVWALACQCGLATAVEVVLLGDGAAWIWDHMAGILGENTICITDWYHVTEHLWKCAKTLFGEGTEAAKAWERKLENLLWEGKTVQLLELLTQEQKTRRGGKRAAIAALITYLKNQGDRLKYAEFRERGLDIGSGRVEAMCKQVGSRMKRSGMCWSDEGAQAVLSLRSVWLNGQWDQFWTTKPMAA